MSPDVFSLRNISTRPILPRNRSAASVATWRKTPAARIASKVILRIVKRPECIRTLLAAFPSTNEAGAAVSGIIAAGMLPAAIEMMDNLAIQAAEAAVHANYPDCGGLLLVELDGPSAEVEALMAH